MPDPRLFGCIHRFPAGDQIDLAELFGPARTGMSDSDKVNEGIRAADVSDIRVCAQCIAVDDLASGCSPRL